MVNIVKLEHPENVRLIAGASQYWTDRPTPMLEHDWSALITPQVHGRTLVVGWIHPTLLTAIADAADDMHVLVRGIVDAADIGTAFPQATVWCGDPADLINHVRDFDTVVCVADASRILPLESETRSWRSVIDAVLALAADHATTLLWVENSLGIHRITSVHNPLARRSDADWDVTATFDDSRPMSLAQVRDAYPTAQVYLTWPSAQWSVLVNPDTVNPEAHVAMAARGALVPFLGPDPAHILSTAARAGRLQDYASGWLVLLQARVQLTAPIYSAERDRMVEVSDTLPDGARPATFVFAELAASHNLPQLRRFMAAWSATHADGTRAASFPLNAVREQDGDYVFDSLASASAGSAVENRWQALGELVAIMRGRQWRHLWPANYTDTRILNHLGIMADLHTVSPARAKQLIPAAPGSQSEYDNLDVASLVATADRLNEQVSTLRSEVALAHHKISSLQSQIDGPLRLPAKVVRIAARTVKRIKK